MIHAFHQPEDSTCHLRRNDGTSCRRVGRFLLSDLSFDQAGSFGGFGVSKLQACHSSGSPPTSLAPQLGPWRCQLWSLRGGCEVGGAKDQDVLGRLRCCQRVDQDQKKQEGTITWHLFLLGNLHPCFPSLITFTGKGCYNGKPLLAGGCGGRGVLMMYHFIQQ